VSPLAGLHESIFGGHGRIVLCQAQLRNLCTRHVGAGAVLHCAGRCLQGTTVATAVAFTFVIAQKDDKSVREEMVSNGRRVPIGTCPSLDYAQRIRRQYSNLSGQTTVQDFVSSKLSPMELD